MSFSFIEVRRRFMAYLLRCMPLLALLAFQPLRPSCGRADEFQCEESAKYLSNCCGKPVSLYCQYRHDVSTQTIKSGGCDADSVRTTTTTVEVDVNPQISACLLGRTCDEIRASGACSVNPWLLSSQCTTRTGACHTYTYIDGYRGSTSCDEYVTCGAPPQSGLCTDYRPKDACDALEKLSCQ